MYTLMHDRWYYEKSVQGRGTHYTLPTMTVTMWSVHVLSPGPGYPKLRVVGTMRNGIGHHVKPKYAGVVFNSMMCTLANRAVRRSGLERYIRATGLTAIPIKYAKLITGQTVAGWPIVSQE